MRTLIYLDLGETVNSSFLSRGLIEKTKRSQKDAHADCWGEGQDLQSEVAAIISCWAPICSQGQTCWQSPLGWQQYYSSSLVRSCVAFVIDRKHGPQPFTVVGSKKRSVPKGCARRLLGRGPIPSIRSGSDHLMMGAYL